MLLARYAGCSCSLAPRLPTSVPMSIAPASRTATCSVAPVSTVLAPALVAFSGGLNLGADTWAAVASTWSGQVFGIELVSQVHRAGFTSLGQLALAAPPCAVVVGWSLGARAATSLGALRERLGLEVKALIALDDRRKLPFAGPIAPITIGGPMACTVATVNMLSAAEAAPGFRGSALC